MECGCDIERVIEGYGPEGVDRSHPVSEEVAFALAELAETGEDHCLRARYDLSGPVLERAARLAGFTPRPDLEYRLSSYRGGHHPALAPVLRDIARINMFFALETDRPEGEWVAVLRGGWSGDLLTAEVTDVRGRLAALFDGGSQDVAWRVGASLFHQGLASRVLSPVLAAAVCHGVYLDPWNLFVRPGGPTVVRTIDTRARPLESCAPQEIARGPVHQAVAGLERVAAALGETGGIAPGLLRGNTAAALAGAARSLGRDRPEHHESAERVVRTLLRSPSLEGTGAYTEADAQGRATFRRTTCCLYYRLPEGGLCGDCALRP